MDIEPGALMERPIRAAVAWGASLTSEPYHARVAPRRSKRRGLQIFHGVDETARTPVKSRGPVVARSCRVP